MQRINFAKFILILKKMGITEAKFHENVLFLKFHDFFPGFPGEWEPCIDIVEDKLAI